MSQTIAILVDAYRELNARKMFWITLIISALFMALFALLGAEENMLTFATYEWPMQHARTVYKSILQIALITIWLTWAAVILALISTGSIFPDFIANGSIDLYLARPISRLRLFVTKYLSALLFVLLQATVFAIGAFFVVGLRADEWKPSLFLAIPLITLFYSYLYSICVLLGIWTRSALAAILLTILIWFAIFGIHAAEAFTLSNLRTAEAYVEIQQERIADADARLARAATQPAGSGNADETDTGAQPDASPAPVAIAESSAVASGTMTAVDGDDAGSPEPSKATLERSRAQAMSDMKAREASIPTLKKWHMAFSAASTILPKTGETVGLLERKLFAPDEMEELFSAAAERRGNRRANIKDEPFEVEFAASMRGSRKVQDEMTSRSPAWIIGSSLAFEAVVLGLAAWMFCRRDY